MKSVAITLVCGLICVGIGYINVWLGILALPILLSISRSIG